MMTHQVILQKTLLMEESVDKAVCPSVSEHGKAGQRWSLTNSYYK